MELGTRLAWDVLHMPSYLGSKLHDPYKPYHTLFSDSNWTLEFSTVETVQPSRHTPCNPNWNNKVESWLEDAIIGACN